MKVIDLDINPTSEPLPFGSPNSPWLLRTYLRFQIGADTDTIYLVSLYHKLPLKKYSLKGLQDTHTAELFHVKSKAAAIKESLECQRYIMVIDALGARGVKRTVPEVFNQGGVYIRGYEPRLDHQLVLKMGNKQWIIMDSPYHTPEEGNAESDEGCWRHVWLEQGSDPYYPMHTRCRLTAHKDSTLDLANLSYKVGDLKFLDPDLVTDPDL